MSTLTISSHPKTGDTIYISNEGDVFYSLYLFSVLMGIDTQTLIQASWFEGVKNYDSEYSNTFLTDGKVTYLIKAEDAYDAMNYYIDEVSLSDCPQYDCSQAIILRQEMGRVGAKMFAYLIGGYIENVTPKEEPTQYEKLVAFNKTMRILGLLGYKLNPPYNKLVIDFVINIFATIAFPPQSLTED